LTIGIGVLCFFLFAGGIAWIWFSLPCEERDDPAKKSFQLYEDFCNWRGPKEKNKNTEDGQRPTPLPSTDKNPCLPVPVLPPLKNSNGQVLSAGSEDKNKVATDHAYCKNGAKGEEPDEPGEEPVNGRENGMVEEKGEPSDEEAWKNLLDAIARGDACDCRGIRSLSSDRVRTILQNAKYGGKEKPVLHDADFSGVIFDGETDFSNVCFSGVTSFCSAIFEGNAVFDKATFDGDAAFQEVSFQRNVFFSASTFRGDSVFSRVKCSENARFNDVSFLGETSFQAFFCGGHARFDEIKCKGNTDFSHSIFHGKSWFGGASFTGKADFSSTYFALNAWFGEAKFLSVADFSSAFFLGSVEFPKTDFGEETILDHSYYLPRTQTALTSVSFGQILGLPAMSDMGSLRVETQVAYLTKIPFRQLESIAQEVAMKKSGDTGGNTPFSGFSLPTAITVFGRLYPPSVRRYLEEALHAEEDAPNVSLRASFPPAFARAVRKVAQSSPHGVISIVLREKRHNALSARGAVGRAGENGGISMFGENLEAEEGVFGSALLVVTQDTAISFAVFPEQTEPSELSGLAGEVQRYLRLGRTSSE